ncbi:MAG: MarR family transcriptional regulator [Bauldia sp.]|nr:MarR family transcriptional regulator [Bauldia sp.]
MADVISEMLPDAAAPRKRSVRPPAPDEIELIELLFFAYRDFVSDPDEVLATYGFGRAHHRVLHFVARNPGIRVADLLDILRITKQSLGRVLKQLVDASFIEQRPGPRDRRQRLLFTTATGQELAERLSEMQSRRIRAALQAVPPAQRAGAREFLRSMIDTGERAKVARLIAR